MSPREQFLAGAALAEDRARSPRACATFCTSSTMSRVLRLGPTTNSRSLLLGDFLAQPHDIAAEILTLAGIGEQRAQRSRGRSPSRCSGTRRSRIASMAVSSSLTSRDDDDLDVRVVLLDDLQDLEAADAGQAGVEQHQVDVFLLHHLEGAFAGARRGARDRSRRKSRSATRASPRRCRR